MTEQLPKHARVVIVGGGIIGCSIAYHLTKAGWTDVVLLERAVLTSGTSWHAAGLVMSMRSTHTLTELCRYSSDLYEVLEKETGQATGFRRVGSLPVARTPERFHEIKRTASLAKVFGIQVDVLSPDEVAKLHPLIDKKRVVGGLFIPSDGQTNPVDTTNALAKGARLRGAKIFERVSVTGITQKNGEATGVQTSLGPISCEKLVLCAGLWTRDLARLAGVHVPLYAAEHMYVTTAPIENLESGLPVIRDADGYVYIKEDAGKLVVGSFEPKGKPLSVERLPTGGEFIELTEDWDHFGLPMSNAIELVPRLENAQIRHFMNGPESFTPDNKFILGEAPEVRNLFVAAGFNSQGILSAAGVGRAMADWIISGEPQMDLSEVDIARFARFQVNGRYLHDRIGESLGLLYGMHWPYRQIESARPVRRSALHDRLTARGACFGETAGWERANWYAPTGIEPRYAYAWGRQNWFPHVRDEHMAVRERAGLFDLSSFAKFQIEGRDAEAELQRLCANDISGPVGKITYTQMLNSRGGIEVDCTVTRMSEDRYWVIDAAANQVRTMHWIKRHLTREGRACITDITSSYGVLSLMGPRSREILARLTPANLSNTAFPFATQQQIEVDYALAYAFRVTYVGELGWELYVPAEFMASVFDAVERAGANAGMQLAGYHALNSLRTEKGYRHWGHDISPSDTPYQAGLGFAVALHKPQDFIGRAAIQCQKGVPLPKRLVHVALKDAGPSLFHDEPIYCDGKIVGRVTSGCEGYCLGAAVGMGYIHDPSGVTAESINGRRFEVEIATERFDANVSLRPFFDPSSLRVRG
jgi:glycine cleavage system T protein